MSIQPNNTSDHSIQPQPIQIEDEGEGVNNEIQPTKNSLVAKSGFRAEDIFCMSPNVWSFLGDTYFYKKVVHCEKVRGHKKSDVCMTFEDGMKTYAQIKNGTGGGRGWSFDRRSVDEIPASEETKQLLRNVCLRFEGERNVVGFEKTILNKFFLGEDENMQPNYFIHTNIRNNKIDEIQICTADLFLNTILNDAYETLQPKKTCVHVTPLIYFQRKGGGKKDHSPNDIQAKLRKMPNCMTTIILPETRPPQLERNV